MPAVNVICTAPPRNLHKAVDRKNIAHMGVINCKKYQNKMLEKNILNFSRNQFERLGKQKVHCILK
jgi:hypothetical protein